jgi:ribosome-associated heat shock protein Hsp15
MRVDQALSRLCLFKTRSQAARACDEGRVLVNGRKARPAHEVRPGDRLVFLDRLGLWRTEVEILGLPETSVSKAEAHRLVHPLSHERVEEPDSGEGAE